MGKYRTIGTDLNRGYRNDLNHNFEAIDDDIKGNAAEITRVEAKSDQAIDDIVGGGFIEGLEIARDNANTSAANADVKAAHANTQGNHAKTQGDYAKVQGDYAKLKGDYADEKAILADGAAANANSEATGLDAMKIAVMEATQEANTSAGDAILATADARLAITDAEVATNNADDATAEAISSAGMADEAALNANTKADLAQLRVDDLNVLDDAINLAIDETEVVKDATILATTNADAATLSADSSASNADEKALLADTAAANADEKALYAKEQGDYANLEGGKATVETSNLVDAKDAVETATLEAIAATENTVTETSNAILATSNADTATLTANISSSNADAKAIIAQTAADNADEKAALADQMQNYAKTQGDYAKAQGEAVQDVFDEGLVASVNGKTGAVVLNATDVGAETAVGAQTKADGAEQSAKSYTDSAIAPLSTRLELEAAGQAAKDYTDAEISSIPDIDLTPLATKVELEAETDARIAHENKQIHEGEVHGLRILDEEFQYFDGVEWVELKGGGGNGIKIGNVSDLTVEALAGLSIKIAWRDPLDVEIDGIPFAKWSGTQLRRKEGNYPLDEKDGTLIVDSKVRDQYVSGYSDSGLVDGVKYFYALFPYTESGDFTYDPSNRVEETALSKFVQDAPIKPTVTGILLNKATVTSSVGSVVSLDNVEWFTSPHEFTDLITDDDYTPYAKFKETETLHESATVTGDVFTASFKSGQIAPVAPSVSNLKFDEATVTGESGTEVRLDSGQWFDSPKTFTGLTAETSYTAYARKKETSTQFASDVSAGKAFETPSALTIYGVAIDTTNSNPATAVTYNEAASGFTSEADFENLYPYNEIKPVMFKNGAEAYDIDPIDFAKKLSGGAIGTNGADGDVFIRFPKVWLHMKRVGTIQFVGFATGKATPEYKCLAHTKAGVEKDYSYIGAYLGFEEAGKLRSIAGKTPTATKTIGQFRTLAQANGVGYQQLSYYQVLMMQVLYLVRYKNRDSQTAIGRGYVDGNASSTTTGGADKKGMTFGETTGKQQMKLFGVEDFWGNLFQFVDGMFNDASRNILIGDNNYNDTGAGYANFGQGSTANLGGYINDIQGGTETGFIAKATTGSETTHYADYGHLHADRLPAFGGFWAVAGSAGAFYLLVIQSASNSNANCGARLSYI